MKFKIITIPFDVERKSFFEEDLNNFCINKQIKRYQPEFFMENGKAYWSVFIEYEPILKELESKNDESEGLDDEEVVLLKKLKEWRNEKASEKGIPPFIILKNSHLKEIVKRKCHTLESLKIINGIGDKKVTDYGKEIIELVKAFYERDEEKK